MADGSMAGNSRLPVLSEQILQLVCLFSQPSQTALVVNPSNSVNVNVKQINESTALHPRPSVLLKVINPKRKREYKTYQLEGLQGIISVKHLQDFIFNSAGKNIVPKDDFDIGYYDGNARMSAISDCFKWEIFMVLWHY